MAGIMRPMRLDPVSRRAIYFVTLREHGYTFAHVIRALESRGVHARHVPWDTVFASETLAHGTWVLSDFERLPPGALMAAGKVHRALKAAGCRVLNDPARWLPRADFLRNLQLAGVNSFGCWRPAAREWPDRWPVFLRRASGHTGSRTELLETPEAARAALTEALDEGLPLSDLLFVEYAGEPVPGQTYFRKHAAFRIGPEVSREVSVNDTTWLAKVGVSGLATDEDYAAERAEMDAYPHEDFVWKVFEIVGLEYGRVDFGTRAERFEVWEVNSNPTLYAPHEHRNADRAETIRLSFERLVTAFWGLARTPGEPVSIKECFRRYRSEETGMVALSNR
ncbi:hypothetical protein [Histidinibacterium lentulum]|uniref:ATP-grasp domain-containing protein n=1 Tax=Histidinibacterium lentulum TaxID=2480588 RepID=A0A3N2QV58_9RHOB|nr:hypothetical protein [Histidinibacterium lentulum]ROT99086.1 hypothetical protein EAT49_15850 [Histidinibacterium lentulum]